jgi:tetratricopeptide (TPR) repeat protein
MILHLIALKGECLLSDSQHERAIQEFQTCIKLYNSWVFKLSEPKKRKSKQTKLKLPSEAFNFGVDEYLKAQAHLAEAFMKIGRIDLAIEKFESVRLKILQEVVFDKPYILINTCSQLGNCRL